MAHLDAETTLQYFYDTAGCVHIVSQIWSIANAGGFFCNNEALLH